MTTTGGLTIVATNRGGSDTGATAVVNNAGTFTKSGSATTSTISTLFNNTGTVNVTRGTLNLSGGGTDSGALNISSGATVQFSSAYTLDGASSTGLGQLQLASSTVTINTTANFASGFTQSGGTLDGTGTSDGNGGLDLFESGRKRVLGRRLHRMVRRSVRRASGWMVVGRCNWAAPARRVEQAFRSI